MRRLIIGLRELRLTWNAESSQIQPCQPAIFVRPGVPSHAGMRQVGQWVAEGGQFPIEDRDDARLPLAEHDVPNPEVAMRHRRDVILRDVFGSHAISRLMLASSRVRESSHCRVQRAIWRAK